MGNAWHSDHQQHDNGNGVGRGGHPQLLALFAMTAMVLTRIFVEKKYICSQHDETTKA
jgi:hypothetical protein